MTCTCTYTFYYHNWVKSCLLNLQFPHKIIQFMSFIIVVGRIVNSSKSNLDNKFLYCFECVPLTRILPYTHIIYSYEPSRSGTWKELSIWIVTRFLLKISWTVPYLQNIIQYWNFPSHKINMAQWKTLVTWHYKKQHRLLVCTSN